MKLLSEASTNAKMAKNEQFSGYLSAILHLAPSTLSGHNVCPAASKGCAMACLNTAGRGRFNNVQEARIRKTKLLYSNQTEFMANLIKDINSLVKKATKQNKKAVVRLNGTSDIDWENIKLAEHAGKNIFELFNNVQFYDYTKRINRLKNKLPKNYHLTFSLSENNKRVAQLALAKGFNVAAVFRTNMPKQYMGRRVKEGISHDFRFKEGYKGLIIGLTAKGKAKKDISGFVID